MRLELGELLRLAWHSVVNPREGAEAILAMGIPREALWIGLLLVVVISVIAAQITLLLAGGEGAMLGGALVNPLLAGAVQLVLLIVTVLAIHHIGRMMGGTGAFDEALLIVTWLQFIMVCLQVTQTLALVILPPLSSLIGIVGLVLFLWLLTNFIAVIHGFRSLGLVFVMILASALGMAFVLSLVLTLFGVTVPGAA